MNGKRMFSEHEVIQAARALADAEINQRNDLPAGVLWWLVICLLDGKIEIPAQLMELHDGMDRVLDIMPMMDGGLRVMARAKPPGSPALATPTDEDFTSDDVSHPS